MLNDVVVMNQSVAEITIPCSATTGVHDTGSQLPVTVIELPPLVGPKVVGPTTY